MSCPAVIMIAMTVPLAWDYGLQRLLNEHPVPPRRTQHWTPEPIIVVTRCVWERDGEQRQAGRAVAWTPRLVLVHFDRELRLQTHGAWFVASDVERQQPPHDRHTRSFSCLVAARLLPGPSGPG